MTSIEKVLGAFGLARGTFSQHCLKDTTRLQPGKPCDSVLIRILTDYPSLKVRRYCDWLSDEGIVQLFLKTLARVGSGNVFHAHPTKIRWERYSKIYRAIEAHIPRTIA